MDTRMLVAKYQVLCSYAEHGNSEASCQTTCIIVAEVLSILGYAQFAMPALL